MYGSGKNPYKANHKKLSGEALAGERGFGSDNDILDKISDQIIEV